jgi:hypothetical protein
MKTKFIILTLAAGVAALAIAQPTMQPGSPSQGASDANGNNPGSPPVYNASTNGMGSGSSATNDWSQSNTNWSNSNTNISDEATNRPHHWWLKW